MVKELSITLDPTPEGGSYSPGSAIRGSLTIEVDKPKRYKFIEVNLLGKGKVRWSEGGAGNTGRNFSDQQNRTHYSASEEYVNQKITLWMCDDPPNDTLSVGRHTYRFRFVLPDNCPSSYSSIIGNISYKIKGLISTGHFKLDHKVKHPITVRELITAAPSAGVRLEKRKTVGCGLCMSGDITYNAQLPSTSFTIGEEIPVSWNVENGSGRRVTLRCSLREKITYFAGGSSRSNTKLVSCPSNVAIPPRSVRDATVSVPIPSCRPAITHSNIIRSEFLLFAAVAIPWACNSNNTIPVTIGNTNTL